MSLEIRVKRIRVKMDRKRIISDCRPTLTKAVLDITRRVMNSATIRCPVDTGNMRGQHYMTVTAMATKVKGIVGNRAKYAAMVHDGTGPHTITAKGRALRFTTGSGVVYRKTVNHPGTSPRPWLTSAAKQVADQVGAKYEGQ